MFHKFPSFFFFFIWNEYQQVSFQNCWGLLAKYSCVEKIFSRRVRIELKNDDWPRRFANSDRFLARWFKYFVESMRKKITSFQLSMKNFLSSGVFNRKSLLLGPSAFSMHISIRNPSRQASLRKDLFRVAGEANRRVISLYRGFSAIIAFRIRRCCPLHLSSENCGISWTDWSITYIERRRRKF